MTREILRDKTLDGLLRFLDGPGLKRGCWAVMILAIMYFGAGFVMSDLVQGIIFAMAG